MRRGVCMWMSVLGLACGSSNDAAPSSGDPSAADAAASGRGGVGGTSPTSAGSTDASVVNGTDGASPNDGGATASEPVRCAPRTVAGDAAMHFHHVHFNTADAAADLAFFETLLGAPAVEFCADAATGAATRATKTERAWFLYTEVDEAPDATLNTYLEHVGWLHPMPTDELLRLVALGATLWPEGRAQCAEAAAGEMACGVFGNLLPDYFFYLQAPSGARIEVARGPGPATTGFGHVHLIQGEDLGFFETVSASAYTAGGAIDMVNHTDASLLESILASEMIVDTRGKPIDHIAYSTTDLVAARDRIAAAGIAIEEDISRKDEYGFESFFVRSPKGIWVEIVADSPFVL